MAYAPINGERRGAGIHMTGRERLHAVLRKQSTDRLAWTTLVDNGMGMMCSISIRELTQEDSRQLASLLCEDRVLRRDLGMAREDRPTGEAFDRHIRDWCRSRNAFTYAIILGDGTAIGTISLSHINRENHSARIGYWIGSSYRNRGYGTKAFERVMAEALSQGMTRVRASIERDNLPSRRIWEGHSGYVAHREGEKVTYEIELNESVD
jgi:[ribosomal protein S5]-alanine N-acetyltransferase